MHKGTLLYLMRDGVCKQPEVALALKKKKIGAGLWNGYGGHCEEKETPQETAVREMREEGRVELEKGTLREVALVTYFERLPTARFRNLDEYEPKFMVHTYLGCTLWGTEPTETDEMGAPTWFAFNKVPYGDMLPADRFILPIILAGSSTILFFEADVYYGPEKKEVEWIAIRPFVSGPPARMQ